MLCKEELSGDNQYHCDFCGKKVDATRQLCLRQLPPYLCMSLQRFVFDMKVNWLYAQPALFIFQLVVQSCHTSSAGGAQQLVQHCHISQETYFTLSFWHKIVLLCAVLLGTPFPA